MQEIVRRVGLAVGVALIFWALAFVSTPKRYQRDADHIALAAAIGAGLVTGCGLSRR